MSEKKYVIDNAALMEKWDWERNADVSPYQLTLGSNKKYGGYVIRIFGLYV